MLKLSWLNFLQIEMRNLLLEVNFGKRYCFVLIVVLVRVEMTC